MVRRLGFATGIVALIAAAFALGSIGRTRAGDGADSGRRDLLAAADGATADGAVEDDAAEDGAREPQDQAAEDKPGPRKLAMKAFMRKKLAASQRILEGLALEDFDAVAQGTKELRAVSGAAEFIVVKDPIYREHADEFRRIVGKMAKAAQEKRIDGATLGFVDMTVSCVECHKFVRTILVAN